MSSIPPTDPLYLGNAESFPTLPDTPPGVHGNVRTAINLLSIPAFVTIVALATESARLRLAAPPAASACARAERLKIFHLHGLNTAELANQLHQFYADLGVAFLLFNTRQGMDERVQLTAMTNVINTITEPTVFTSILLLSLVLHLPTRLVNIVSRLIVDTFVYPCDFPPRISAAQKDVIIEIGKSVRATKYDNATEQRIFLDGKTEALDAFSPFITEIADTPILWEVGHTIKNSYHQTAGITGGVIAGRYSLIIDFCARLKAEKERIKGGVLLNQQQHRAELDDLRSAKEAQDAEVRAAKEAARASKEAAKKAKKPKKAKKVTVDDIDDDVSIFDDAETHVQGSAVDSDFDNAVEELHHCFRAFQVTSSTQETSNHRQTQVVNEPTSVSSPLDMHAVLEQISQLIAPIRSQTVQTIRGFDRLARPYLKAMTILARSDPNSEQRVVAEEFSPPSTRKRARHHGTYAHEDSPEQFAAAELSVNNDRVKSTVATAHAAVTSSAYQATIGSLRLEESDLRSRIAFANAQLRYELNHREYLIGDLQRVLDAQHQRQS
ncbi:hypothetical protein FB451DRAFT_1387893 [Mycena latifolia]|nr:hypothetical protein FB451DRAFT_1387893 [Mycena latifolia]